MLNQVLKIQFSLLITNLYIVFNLYQGIHAVLDTVVGDYINTLKTTFYWSFSCYKFFRIISLQAGKEKLFLLTASLCFHVYVFPCFLKAWDK